MPKYQHRIDTHQLFLIEQRGDTLIVSPKGDPAGFANLNFNLEHAALLSLIQKEQRKNLLVDLSASNYFGAKILGAFSDWSDAVEAEGGKFALCELSHDMQELLKIFQFEDRWQLFDTREEGIKAIVKESAREVLWHKWKQLAFLASAAVFVGMAFLPWNEYYFRYLNERDYQKVHVIWVEMQELKAQNAPAPEWRKLQNRAHSELAPLLPDLEKRAGRRTRQMQLAQALYFAIRDNILKHLLIKQNRLSLYRPVGPKKEEFWLMTAAHMEIARRILHGEDPDTVEFPNRFALRKAQQTEDGETPPEESEWPTDDPPGNIPADVPPAIAEKPNPDTFPPEHEPEPEPEAEPEPDPAPENESELPKPRSEPPIPVPSDSP